MAKCVRVFLTNTAMISKKLQFLFLLSLMLIVIHGIEEQLTGFRHTDSFVIALGSYLSMSPEAFYWAFHIIWWSLLPSVYILLRKNPVMLPLLTLFSVVFVFELHHVVKAFVANSYYPGMITAAFYPVLGVFFYKELVQSWRFRLKNKARGSNFVPDGQHE